VKDPVVNLLAPIDGGFEAGVFAGWHYTRLEGIPFRVRLGVMATTAISGGAAGGHVTPYASLWVPLSRTVFVGFGGGFTWSSASFMQQRFGVSPAASAASGLPVFSASAGIRQLYLWPALMIKLSPSWYAGGGAFWQRITGDGADSPIITQRGERDQITAGIGLGYSW
jgi:MipA family protein